MDKIKSKFRWHYLIFVAIIAVAVIASFIYAKYFKQINDLNNTFIPAESTDPAILEDFNGTLKENVKFNVGDTGYPVYVRAELVFTWKNKEGIIYFEPVKESDYSIDLNLTETGWVEGEDGYYYYQPPVESGDSTENLINSCMQVNFDTAPEGYSLNLEILVQTVQAIGSTDDNGEIPAYKDAWNEKLNLDEKYYD